MGQLAGEEGTFVGPVVGDVGKDSRGREPENEDGAAWEREAGGGCIVSVGVAGAGDAFVGERETDDSFGSLDLRHERPLLGDNLRERGRGQVRREETKAGLGWDVRGRSWLDLGEDIGTGKRVEDGRSWEEVHNHRALRAAGSNSMVRDGCTGTVGQAWRWSYASLC